ncbi:MAG: hypothetical protein ACOX2N_01725 [Peptococcia bacterium]|jgi:competence protein ComGC
MTSKDRLFWEHVKDSTLFEIVIVLIMLAIVLLTSVFELWQVQVQAAWEADSITLKNIAKIAQLYALSENKIGEGVSVRELIDENLIEDQPLNRRCFYRTTGTWKSYRNSQGKKLSEVCLEERPPKIIFNQSTGSVSNFKIFVITLIGHPPYVRDVDEYLEKLK